MQPDCFETPKRAIISSRNSQLKQTGNTWSIQRQIDHCIAYCLEHGYILAEDQIHYEAREGTVNAGRPELERLRKAVQQGFIEVLVLASRERLIRDDEANARPIEQLTSTGIVLAIVEDTQCH
jgi:DNA invertase Pin-like site-specific DNA recombinase